MSKDNQQRICTSKPFCLCVGEENPWDECCCTGNVVGCEGPRCLSCGAPLETIDTDTGETVKAAA
jgi:hypothetical protein